MPSFQRGAQLKSGAPKYITNLCNTCGWVCNGWALDLRLDGRKLDSRSPRLVLGWVTVFGRANHIGISPSNPGQLNLLPYAKVWWCAAAGG